MKKTVNDKSIKININVGDKVKKIKPRKKSIKKKSKQSDINKPNYAFSIPNRPNIPNYAFSYPMISMNQPAQPPPQNNILMNQPTQTRLKMEEQPLLNKKEDNKTIFYEDYNKIFGKSENKKPLIEVIEKPKIFDNVYIEKLPKQKTDIQELNYNEKLDDQLNDLIVNDKNLFLNNDAAEYNEDVNGDIKKINKINWIQETDINYDLLPEKIETPEIIEDIEEDEIKPSSSNEINETPKKIIINPQLTNNLNQDNTDKLQDLVKYIQEQAIKYPTPSKHNLKKLDDLEKQKYYIDTEKKKELNSLLKNINVDQIVGTTKYWGKVAADLDKILSPI